MALADRPQLGGAERRQDVGPGPRAGTRWRETSVCALARGADEVDDLVREVGIGERVVGRPAVDRRDRGGRAVGSDSGRSPTGSW